MKKLLSLLSFSTLLIPVAASSQEVSHTTNFALITKVGTTTTRYSLSEKQRVVMPSGVEWACNSHPVELSPSGSVYQAGFYCQNCRGDAISVQSNCYANRVDHELNAMSVTTTDAETGVIRFIVECATEENGSGPSLRRS
jgi:hypothetical protein